MARLYVDPLFASQGSRKVWASGTPSAEVVDPARAFATIALALASADFDAAAVLRVAPGSHALPAAFTQAVVQVEGCGATTTLTGATEVDDAASLRVENVAVDGDWTAFGKVGLTRCLFSQDSSLVASGGSAAVVCAEYSGPTPQAVAGGAVAVYPAARDSVGGPGSRRVSEYNLTGRLEAPARDRSAGGNIKGDLRWVWLKDVKVRRQEQSGREGQQGALAFADTSGVFYCRGGVPVTADMRIKLYGTTYQIRGVSQSPPPENELTLFVTDRTKAV